MDIYIVTKSGEEVFRGDITDCINHLINLIGSCSLSLAVEQGYGIERG